MPKITFINFEGNKQTVDAQIGDSVMQAATENDIEGIEADCGGSCSCATCHCYVSEEWQEMVGEASEMETEMLSMAEDVKDNSRLACQIEVTDAHDGLVVTTPESQY